MIGVPIFHVAGNISKVIGKIKHRDLVSLLGSRVVDVAG
jgi:hypothetical protein